MPFVQRSCVLAVLFGFSLIAAAGGEERHPVPPPKIERPSDERLRSFAAATLEVERLSQAWLDRLAEVDELAERQEMRVEVLREMAAALRKQGLTVDEYNAISQLVQGDAEVAGIVDDYRRELAR